MKLCVSLDVNASTDKVWSAITNIPNSDQYISGIEKIEILEPASEGIHGLKWRETRTMFGKTATEVMWITGVDEGKSYEVRAESHGMVYESVVGVKPNGDKSTLYMEFGGTPQNIKTKILGAIMAPLFKGATKKALMKDLEDIKAHVEQ